MKPFVPLVALLTTLAPWAAGTAVARESSDRGIRIHCSDCDGPARWGDRHDTREARMAITTTDGDVTLLLTDDVVALQFSDRTWRRIGRELDDERDADDGALARALKNVVVTTVRSVLAHGAECPLVELRDARYVDGRLQLIGRSGDTVFEDFELDATDVMDSFWARDARAFVSEFRKVKGLSR